MHTVRIEGLRGIPVAKQSTGGDLAASHMYVQSPPPPCTFVDNGCPTDEAGRWEVVGDEVYPTDLKTTGQNTSRFYRLGNDIGQVGA